jgi:hypothetical protein
MRQFNNQSTIAPSPIAHLQSTTVNRPLSIYHRQSIIVNQPSTIDRLMAHGG